MLLAVACSSSIPERSAEVDCSVNDEFEFQVLQPMEGATASWFNFGDMTPGGFTSFAIQPIPEGRCESTAALLLTARGHTDWGAGFGEYQTAMAPVVATDYEGISFWARATGYGRSSGFVLNLNDRNTFAVMQNMDPNGPVCTVPDVTDTAGGYTVNEAGMLVPVGGDLPGPNDCGNPFTHVIAAQREWTLHVLPFESFHQEAFPNREPLGVDRSALYQFGVSLRKDSNIELWLDDLSLYRRLQPTAPAAAASAEQ